MKNYKLLIVIRLLIVGSLIVGTFFTMSGQDEVDDKNLVYITGGTTIFESQVSMAYERAFYHKNAFQTNGRLMLGTYVSNNLDYSPGARRYKNYLGLSVVQMIYFVEVNVGVTYASFTLAPNIPFDLETEIDVEEIDPTKVEGAAVLFGGIGLRFELENYIIRGGINNLELLYLGVGMTF